MLVNLTSCATVLVIDRNLDLSILRQGKMYCTSFGDNAGDFHFVMDRLHAEALARIHFRTEAPVIFKGHGWIKNWMLSASGVEIANDNQLFGGMDEEVFRKTDFFQMTCNGYPFWKAFWAGYGMTDGDWEDQRQVAGRRKCPSDRPVFAIHRFCCSRDSCLSRSASNGTCCHKKAKHGAHHCLRGPD